MLTYELNSCPSRGLLCDSENRWIVCSSSHAWQSWWPPTVGLPGYSRGWLHWHAAGDLLWRGICPVRSSTLYLFSILLHTSMTICLIWRWRLLVHRGPVSGHSDCTGGRRPGAEGEGGAPPPGRPAGHGGVPAAPPRARAGAEAPQWTGACQVRTSWHFISVQVLQFTVPQKRHKARPWCSVPWARPLHPGPGRGNGGGEAAGAGPGEGGARDEVPLPEHSRQGDQWPVLQ